MSKAHSSNMINPIVNKNFDNTFHRQNGPKQRQHVHNHTGQKCQLISFQISSNSSPTYLKESFLGFVIDNKEVRSLLIQNGEELETLHFRGELFIIQNCIKRIDNSKQS